MKEKLSKAIEEFTLDPPEIDGIFMELCSLINMIYSLEERDCSDEEILEKLILIDDRLLFLEQRTEKLNVPFLLSQISKHRFLISKIKDDNIS
jgi:hypothetical protein